MWEKLIWGFRNNNSVAQVIGFSGSFLHGVQDSKQSRSHWGEADVRRGGLMYESP